MKMDPLGIIKPQKRPIPKRDAYYIGIEVIECIQKKEMTLEDTRAILHAAGELLDMYIDFGRDKMFTSQIDMETLRRAFSRKEG